MSRAPGAPLCAGGEENTAERKHQCDAGQAVGWEMLVALVTGTAGEQCPG